MKIKLVVSALTALTLAATGGAYAQDQGDRNDRGRNQNSQGRDRPDQRGNLARQVERQGNQGESPFAQRSDRGASADHGFRRGERIPMEYRNRQYVVDDWRGHRLSAPPRGYHWVQSGGDYVLVAIATGIILQVLLNH